MRRLTMVIVMAVCLFSLSGFSYNKDKGRAYSPDTSSYNPLCISLMESVMKEAEYPSTRLSTRLIHFLFEPGEGRSDVWTPMEALDKVKQQYATNFDPVSIDMDEKYYYKLKDADYYLVYEGIVEEHYYLYHLYEFVLDEPDIGVGHTVTYGWYWVDQRTGEILPPTTDSLPKVIS